MTPTHIWWIRRDIRLHDNQALKSAIKDAEQFIPLFILEPSLLEAAAPKRRAFFLNALSDLNDELQLKGSHLIVREGPALNVFQQLSTDLGDFAIFAHEDFSPFARERDLEIANAFDLITFPGVVLRHPSEVKKEDSDPYLVYTPYKKRWYRKSLPTPADCLSAPKSLPPLPKALNSLDLPSSDPVPGFPASASKAQSRLQNFIEGPIQQYQSNRDQINLDGTSRLSPYLRFGLISVREAFAQAQIALLQAKEDRTRREIRIWIDELVWREFYTQILYHFPRVLKGPFREEYAHLRWRDAPQDLINWQEGQTGYPIVDACMRQLKQTGWMHNRGRMIVASFLTKNLLINWQVGEEWFLQNLVDGDPAANNGGWQWTAGTGTDAAPYFRIFNPVLQGQKHDPTGSFIAEWVPELAKLPGKYRHEPWKLQDADADKFGFTLGEDYPRRIVDHMFARQRTLAAYRAAREKTGNQKRD